jgi:FOG: LysM repeat
MPLDARNYYLIRSTNGASVLCRRGQEPPKLISGGARYSVVDRARRKSTVQWEGDDPYRMDLPILLDGWMSGASVEMDVSRLNSMMRSPGDLIPPAKVYIDGAVPVKGAKWAIETIDWGDMVLWTADATSQGYRLRQDATIHLLQFLEPKVLQVATPNMSIPITVKAGETAASIAKDNNIPVADLLRANNIRDGKTIKTGVQLVIPPSYSKDSSK